MSFPGTTTDPPELSDDELHEINRDPVGFLGLLGVQSGAPHFRAFTHARDLIVEYGTCRRIDRDSAALLCRRMAQWARAAAPRSA